jgi:hypothetical protein
MIPQGRYSHTGQTFQWQQHRCRPHLFTACRAPAAQRRRRRPLRCQLVARPYRPSRRQLVGPLLRPTHEPNVSKFYIPFNPTDFARWTSCFHLSSPIPRRRLYFVFDEPVTLSVVRLWNYGARWRWQQRVQQAICSAAAVSPVFCRPPSFFL